MANRRGERTVLIERGGDNLSYRTVALDAGEGGAMENTAFVNDEEDFATNRRPDLTLADDSISAITVTPEPEEGGAGPTLRDTSQTTSDRPRSQEDLLFRLRVAHLTPGVDWFEEILSVARTGGSEDVELLRHVLNTLREYPLSMKDKIILS
ncbi:uncharacterized protein LOC118477636 [Aplysia californica]|uniref:Uncharacterized protein LOC118477636 n=1 Tax=Aplysia californica TaxID=6500 RepID=A0ABM1VSU9_APLCA|nr:uncharacterized protein LOC118477636 [Aplysia californica]